MSLNQLANQTNNISNNIWMSLTLSWKMNSLNSFTAFENLQGYVRSPMIKKKNK